MRAALLTLAIVAALFLASSHAWTAFNCFETPEGEHRCACIGLIAANYAAAAHQSLYAIMVSLALSSVVGQRCGLQGRVFEKRRPARRTS